MSKKISDFIVDDAIPDTALITYVDNGQNKTITQAAYLLKFGVTGSMAQEGALGSTAILDVDGTVNKIRSVEDGPGIIASISPENGLKLSHNFIQDTLAVAVLGDATLPRPVFASLQADTGISIVKDGNVIKISATGALPATKAVAVNSMSDFPAAVTGVRTLESGTAYVISNDMTTTDRFVLGNDTSIVGYSRLSPTLSYTGIGTMFTAVDAEVGFFDIRVDCPSGKVFDVSDTVGGVKELFIHGMQVVSCDTIGDIASFREISIEGFECNLVGSSGFLITSSTNGKLYRFSDVNLESTSATFIGIDFGTSVSENIRVEDSDFSGVSGAIAVKGAANNANLTATGKGEVIGNAFDGAITPVSGIDVLHDSQWLSLANKGVTDTRPDSMSYSTAGTTVTIATVSTPVAIGGVWVDDNSAHFTVNGTGRVTYIGVNDFHSPIDVSITADPASGSNKDFSVSIAINGVSVVASAVPSQGSSGDKISVSTFWQYQFSTGDYIEVMIQNDTDAVDMNVSHALLRLN